MQCFSPVWNGIMSVNCGQCYACIQSKRNEWTFRILQEEKDCKNSSFVTLTYDDEYLKYGSSPTLFKKDVQDYLKRVRKENPYFHTEPIKDTCRTRKVSDMKYYFVGEYGSKGNRPHYHGIVFNADREILRKKWRAENAEGEVKDIGYVHLGEVTQASIHYVTKYIVNKRKNSDPGRQDEFALMSNGLGLGYVKKHRKYHVENDLLYLTFNGGRKTKLFRYYKNKIWKNENEVKRLAAITLDNLDSYYLDAARQEAENKRFFTELANKQYNRTRRMNKFNKSKNI